MITGKILKLNGWPDGKIIGLAKDAAAIMEANGMDRDAILARLESVRSRPGTALADPMLEPLAREWIRINEPKTVPDCKLRSAPLAYPIWGRENIDPASLTQMDNALRLPVSICGALMPDAHVGYGLPIGGVLAVDNAVIPFAVGVDIACRMRLSIYSLAPHVLGQQKRMFEEALVSQTRFGVGGEWPIKQRPQHEVIDDPAWNATRLLTSLQSAAAKQLGTSGSGNHFVEWGAFHLNQPFAGLEPGDYLALLSHSGSRSIGYKIADAYSKRAQELHKGLDQSVRHLAWLPLDSEDGQEYWLSMELAGRFASANHAIIHQRVAQAAGIREVAAVENHHNFAWKETLSDGREAVIHRKGATPAGMGQLGVIPGSMGDPGYLVRGLGGPESLNSASHGAGRLMSRKAALNSISKGERDAYLKQRGVTLLGGGLDESPQAYKPIDEVMAAQHDLVEIIGRFNPRIVCMAGEAGDV